MGTRQQHNQGYHYPASDAFTEKVHSVEGVNRLTSGSNIEKLLAQMEADGHEVGAAISELKALLNFVTHSKKINSECLTHIDYMRNLLKK